MATARDPTAVASACSSSEATESDNNSAYDHDKSPTTTLRLDDVVSIYSRSSSSLSHFADNDVAVANVEYYDPAIEDRLYDRDMIVNNVEPRRGTANKRPTKSYEIRSSSSVGGRGDDVVIRRGFESADLNTAQHEHYMIPTHETNPNRTSDKRTLSLFNPEFLPNFNDMLMYVGGRCSDVPNDSQYNLYHQQPPQHSSQSFPNKSSYNVHIRDDDRIGDETTDYSCIVEPNYATLRHDRRNQHQPYHQQRDQDCCENVYAPVGLEALQGRANIDYNC